MDRPAKIGYAPKPQTDSLGLLRHPCIHPSQYTRTAVS
jgi:hypothetical protein